MGKYVYCYYLSTFYTGIQICELHQRALLWLVLAKEYLLIASERHCHEKSHNNWLIIENRLLFQEE